MIAEIVATGEELRLGSVVDTNSAYIARELTDLGIHVTRHSCVGDDMDTLVSLFIEISNRADVAVVTGGLGPTEDDLTAAAAATAAGVELKLDLRALEAIENFFKARKRSMPSSNRKQAMLPKGAECIINPIGTAPAFLMKMGRCRFFFLPGAPLEVKRIMSDVILPKIADLWGKDRSVFLTKTLCVFGITEAETGERLEAVGGKFPGVRVGLRAVFPIIQIKLYAKGTDDTALQRQLEDASGWVLNKFGNKVFSVDGNAMEVEIGNLLRQNKATLGVAESCTGGLISDWITNVSGSSDYFLLSAVTYSNDAKVRILGVSADTIEKYGAVHEETAKQMAAGVRRISGATYGLSTSGIAGPTGGTPEKPVGTVCIGLATPEGVRGMQYNFPYQERWRNKSIFAITALDLLRRELLMKQDKVHIS
ncbi:MAG: CinA family nicotinamide mononucleotide deamidase-related protein [Deltaproteobacteria bacterium]|nr:CinA family nicotinamide mononucleotide deamidase-related protein [Deltaproteobacteria bacterium]MBW1960775.1 CinA family nicotinamide mononucleotide deamidase-related protein [Deltaproteobacteria bacterium]MBW2153939.1 CinA family nicotinamide mononucleotide deamidase-related protein [Deltaproteobacteria bacterium]